MALEQILAVAVVQGEEEMELVREGEGEVEAERVREKEAEVDPPHPPTPAALGVGVSEEEREGEGVEEGVRDGEPEALLQGEPELLGGKGVGEARREELACRMREALPEALDEGVGCTAVRVGRSPEGVAEFELVTSREVEGEGDALPVAQLREEEGELVGEGDPAVLALAVAQRLGVGERVEEPEYVPVWEGGGEGLPLAVGDTLGLWLLLWQIEPVRVAPGELEGRAGVAVEENVPEREAVEEREGARLRVGLCVVVMLGVAL